MRMIIISAVQQRVGGVAGGPRGGGRVVEDALPPGSPPPGAARARDLLFVCFRTSPSSSTCCCFLNNKHGYQQTCWFLASQPTNTMNDISWLLSTENFTRLILFAGGQGKLGGTLGAALALQHHVARLRRRSPLVARQRRADPTGACLRAYYSCYAMLC